MKGLYGKMRKLIVCLRVPLFRKALLHGVAATTEHLSALATLEVDLVVDVGANKGQFALAALYTFPDVTLHCFEPLEQPLQEFLKIHGSNRSIHVSQIALGGSSFKGIMHVSQRIDSSSLLPISTEQSRLFPGTKEVSQEETTVDTLDNQLSDVRFKRGLLKIDVQGGELDVLRGASSCLNRFTNVYVECSFLELYTGQSLAHEVIEFLAEYGFSLVGVYNLQEDDSGSSIQADFMFAQASAHRLTVSQ